MSILTPTTPEEAAASVREAAEARAPLSIVGLGSKSALGAPWNAARRLDLSKLAGITFYEPEELVLCAQAATPIETIETLLAANGQELAFEPISFSALFGAGAGSIGGCLMANLSGPRRVKAGAARDHVLGVKAINGRGEAFKAGGTVVKNVTGYDLSRGLAGSFGTLAVVTEVNFKVLPRAETAATLVLNGLAPKPAVAALCAAMGSPADVSGAAHLPPFAAQSLGFAASATLLRLEGFAPSVNERFDRLKATLSEFGAAERLGAEATQTIWRAIRDVVPLAAPREKIIWKISVAPTAGPGVAATISRAFPCEAMFDWSGGLVWVALDPDVAPDAGAELIRGAVMVHGGGHATLIRAPSELRAATPVFQPQPPALKALSERLKAQFDPYGILERGRMQAQV
ncbi:FAD linked oxidase domain protein [Methylocella silvestris BL2]|uniref:FAD linked oxidase domain protein n=1 Tax=Methylocella silvestris (strain DSM 15510 / CIP 108128 / LMG 27833 / NCIMB 13906 / BL2) TaxID=395965 RepID=B8EM76_METSB|nr:FAD-binding protein [Methylocella silvestris]ACK51465.1 FAD linked oxidase domain protein [Methylocella silvestris BL2]